MGREERRARAWYHQGLAAGTVQRVVGRVAVACNPPQHKGAPAPCAIGRDEGIVGRGSTGQTCEQRRLAEGEASGSGVEVQGSRGIDANRPLPQRHAVQVLLEDLLLGKMGLQPQRPERLRDLASQRVTPTWSQETREL